MDCELSNDKMPMESIYHNVPKFSDRQVWANIVDSDQTAQDLHCLPFCLHLFGALQQLFRVSEFLGILQ